jgi:hypothetical protein
MVVSGAIWLRAAKRPAERERVLTPQEVAAMDIRYDLRRRSPTRGDETTPDAALECSRRRVRLTILLPIGSEEGAYDVVLSRPGNAAIVARSVAHRSKGISVLQVQLDLTNATAGRYNLRIQQVGSLWHDFPLNLR